MSKISAAGTIHAKDGKFEGRVRSSAGQLSLVPDHSDLDPDRLDAARIEDHEERVAALAEADGIYVEDANLQHVDDDGAHTWSVVMTNSRGEKFELEYTKGNDETPQTAEVMESLVSDAQLSDEYGDDYASFRRGMGMPDFEDDVDDVDEDIQSDEWKEWNSEYNDLIEKRDNLMSDGADEGDIEQIEDDIEYHYELEPERIGAHEHKFNQMRQQSNKFKHWVGYDEYDAYANGSAAMDKQLRTAQWQEMEGTLNADSHSVESLAAPGRSDNDRLHDKAVALRVVESMMREDDEHDVGALREKIRLASESNDSPGYREGFALALEKLDRYDMLRGDR